MSKPKPAVRFSIEEHHLGNGRTGCTVRMKRGLDAVVLAIGVSMERGRRIIEDYKVRLKALQKNGA